MKKTLFNPYLPPDEYIPDAEPRVFENRLFIYGSHDQPNHHKFCVGDYAVWSAPLSDLSDWKYEGISYTRTSDPHNSDGTRTLFAPDVIQGRDGNYYLYYCLSFLEEFGVAKSSAPQGPFEFYGHVKNRDGSSYDDFFPYDPSIFIDDDGRIYLYYGFSPDFTNPAIGSIASSPGCMVVELEEDMLTVKTSPVMCLPGYTCCKGTSFSREHAYFEAPSMRKINGLYYLIYSSQNHHELCYAVSSSPDQDFIYQGVILSNGNIGYQGNQNPVYYTGNNHGGLVKLNGQWYIFYHRHTHAISSSRQGCAEKIFLKEDGTIPQVPLTSYGLSGEPFYGQGEYPAYIACHLERKQHSVSIEYGKDYKDSEPYIFEESGGQAPIHYIANITSDVKWGFKDFIFRPDTAIHLTLRGNARGILSVYRDADETYKLAEIPLCLNTNSWTVVRDHLKDSEGVHGLYFVFHGNGVLQCKSFCLI